MTAEQFQRELDYGVTMALCKEMLAAGLITEEEFIKIDRLCLERDRPIYQFAGAEGSTSELIERLA